MANNHRHRYTVCSRVYLSSSNHLPLDICDPWNSPAIIPFKLNRERKRCFCCFTSFTINRLLSNKIFISHKFVEYVNRPFLCAAITNRYSQFNFSDLYNSEEDTIPNPLFSFSDTSPETVLCFIILMKTLFYSSSSPANGHN